MSSHVPPKQSAAFLESSQTRRGRGARRRDGTTDNECVTGGDDNEKISNYTSFYKVMQFVEILVLMLNTAGTTTMEACLKN